MSLSMSTRALIGGLVWVAIGIMLIVRGTDPYWFDAVASDRTWAWTLLGIGIVIGAAKGLFVIRKSARRMVTRIESHPEPAPFWQIYPPYLFLLIPLMIAMGLGLKAWVGDTNPGVVTAVYVGIGAALFASSLPFFKAWKRLAS